MRGVPHKSARPANRVRRGWRPLSLPPALAVLSCVAIGLGGYALWNLPFHPMEVQISRWGVSLDSGSAAEFPERLAKRAEQARAAGLNPATTPVALEVTDAVTAGQVRQVLLAFGVPGSKPSS